MKRLLFLLFTACTLAHTVMAQSAAPGAQHDKAFLLDYYQQTFDALAKSVEGLSDAQLAFKSAPDRWSISQCLEHIIQTEPALFVYAKKTLEQQPNPERRGDVKMSDDDVINGMTDRSFKAKASEELSPKEAGTYTNGKTALKDLKKQRKALLDFIKETSVDDMRNRITDSPFGAVDGYHALLYIPAHTARHTLQIEEIKADPNFPR
ncbi:DinB family protein [Parapedobacter sp. GCM10030251]|uniref:DinB family protein n=1 Tax=Parapedobacter sp. GCM10030251 TaxID=3273419 RepID=UPI00361F0958